MLQDKKKFIELLLDQGVLSFGDFTLKSGRQSPYFFNMGSVKDGVSIARFGDAYAQKIRSLDVSAKVLFGPAYKGIPIAVSAAIALAGFGVNMGVAFNRKEVKDHGEGGSFVGADVTGDVFVVDDVLTAGTAIREACSMIKSAGGNITGVLVAIDRQEIMAGGETAVNALREDLGVAIHSLINLQDVIEYLDLSLSEDKNSIKNTDGSITQANGDVLAKLVEYQQQYCLS